MDGKPDISEDDLPTPSAFSRFHPFLKGVFSQWHATPFVIDGRRFDTAEQWMMFRKALLFDDQARAAAILATPDPAEQKRLGQRVEAFEQESWDRWKVDIVHRGSVAKFSQNDGAKRQLVATGNAMLVEANPRDWIWGCGLSADDPAIIHPAEWKGANLLGRVLTHVRERLMNS